MWAWTRRDAADSLFPGGHSALCLTVGKLWVVGKIILCVLLVEQRCRHSGQHVPSFLSWRRVGLFIIKMHTCVTWSEKMMAGFSFVLIFTQNTSVKSPRTVLARCCFISENVSAKIAGFQSSRVSSGESLLQYLTEKVMNCKISWNDWGLKISGV